jgi:hypothetical protein
MTVYRDRVERAAQMIEQLLGDPDLRASFRRRPGDVARSYGLADVAAELNAGERPLQTLDGRESRSSLAGALLAAAAEGVQVADLLRAAHHEIGGEGAQALERGATRHRLAAVAAERPAGQPAPAASPTRHAEPGATPRTPTLRPHRGAAAADDTGRSQRGGAAADPSARAQHGGSAADPTHASGSGAADAPAAGYPGDDAPRPQIAAWMAAEARRAGLPPELPVMAALQESSLRNVHFGDRDSVGYFQMRKQYWDRGPWRGYLQRPQLQIKWFIQRALEERRSHPGVYRSPSDYGHWIADIERCAEGNRGLYQRHLAVARELIEAGGGRRSSPPPAHGDPPSPRHATPPPAAGPVPAGPSPIAMPPMAPGVAAPPPAAPGGAAPPPGSPVAGASVPGAPPPDAPVAGAAMPGSPVPGTPFPAQTPGAGAVAFAAAPPPATAAPPIIRNTNPIAVVRAGAADGHADPEPGGDSVGERMVELARREIGVAETSTNDSPRIADYRSATAGATTPGPWCAYFVSWLAKRAGSPLGDHGQGFGLVDDVWAWAKSAGRAVPVGAGVKPHAGDLVVWDEHIGIVEKVLPDGRIQTIEGNSGDHVAVRIHPAGDAIGYVRMP